MRAELENWYRFIRANSHVLHRPQRLFQLAINEPDSSPIAKSAAERLRIKRETRPWLRWINKPQERNPCLVTLTGGGRKSGFAFSPDSTRIVTGWSDESMQVWNAQTGQSLVHLPCLTTPKYERDLTVMGCAFVADGKRIVTYVEDDSLKLWDAETGDEVAWLARHGEGAKTWCASRDGRKIAAWFWEDNQLKIWDTATAKLLTTGHSPADITMGPMAFSPDNLFLGRASMSGTCEIFTGNYREPVVTLQLGFVDNFEFSPDQLHLLTTDNVGHAAHLWNIFAGELSASFKGHEDRITACHFSPDGSRVVTASWDKTVKLWSNDGEELQTFAGHGGYVKDCAFSPDGRLVVSASEDMTLKLWDCENGALLATFVGHALPVAACAFSPDGKLIASTSNETTRIWDASARTGPIDPPHRLRTCAFSVDGTKAVVDETLVVDVANANRLDDWNCSVPSFDLKASSCVDVSESEPTSTRIRFSAEREYVIDVIDQKLKVLDANDHLEVRILSDKAPATFCVSPDGQKIVCAILENFFDQSLKCFETLTGNEKFSMEMRRPYGDRTQLRFTFDGRTVVILTSAGSLLLIDADSGKVMSEFLHHESVETFDTSPTENVVLAGGQLGSVFVLRLENFN